jgi:hypothetical protein
MKVAADRTEPDRLEVSAYYPEVVKPEMWCGVYAYIFRSSAAYLVTADLAGVVETGIAGYRKDGQYSRIPLREGVIITATLAVDHFAINPDVQRIAIHESFHRLEFRVKASPLASNQCVTGSLTFSVEGVIIADVHLAITVSNSDMASERKSVTRPVYTAVFCSYSHKDHKIVDRIEKACNVLRMKFLRDATTLQSGEKWNPRLLTFIEIADVFQLFWSENARHSKHVEREWRHALAQRDKPERFIRPVYWKEPMAKAPPELSEFHFAYRPELVMENEEV